MSIVKSAQAGSDTLQLGMIRLRIGEHMLLHNQVALVTGAGKGIGRGISLALAKEGAKVVIADIDRESGENTAREIRESGADALFVQMNIANEGDVLACRDTVLEHYGKLDILVCNAGITYRKPFLELTPEEWDRTISINLTGTFYTIKGFVDSMVANGRGKIIIIASAAAITGSGGGAHYASTKAVSGRPDAPPRKGTCAQRHHCQRDSAAHNRHRHTRRPVSARQPSARAARGRSTRAPSRYGGRYRTGGSVSIDRRFYERAGYASGRRTHLSTCVDQNHKPL